MLSIPYLAGFYEGEGCLNQTSPYGFRITIVSTDYDVLLRIQDSYGGTLHPMKSYQEHHKPAWRWRLGKRSEVSSVLSKMLPWLGNRRGYDAQNALDTIDKL